MSKKIFIILQRTSCQWGHAAVWEFPAVKFSSSVLPCFLTLNTLYLLQFEIDPRITPVSKICFKDLLEKVTFIQVGPFVCYKKIK